MSLSSLLAVAVLVTVLVVVLILVVLILILVLIAILISVLVIHIYFLPKVAGICRCSSLPNISGFILCAKQYTCQQA